MNPKTKKSSSILTAVSVLLLSAAVIMPFSGCKNKNSESNQSDSSDAPAKKITIGFSIDTLAIERWQRDLDVFMNVIKENGAEVIVQNAGNNLEEQNRQLMYLADRNVDCIVVLPKDANGISESVQKIKAKGIPVISYDRLTLNADIDLYLSINSEKVGELMAQGTLARTRGRSWFYILGPEEDYNMTLIKKGINNIISKNTNVSIDYVYYTDGWNYDLAHEEMIRLIKNGRIPNAIICGNDAVADSVIQALTTYYNGDHICICGQDADIAACQNIINKKQDFTVYKPITKLAETAAIYAVRIAKGESVEELSADIASINNGFGKIPVIWLDPVLVDNKNMDKIVIDSGFHTHYDVYRD